MTDTKELVDRLRNDRARYFCDNDYSVARLASNCGEAADIIELLDDELKQQKRYAKVMANQYQKLTEELIFTRDFILRHGLQYALAAEWNKKDNNV